MSIEIGLQLFSARNAFIEDRSGTLRTIAEIGYKHIEVPVDFSGLDLFGTGELAAADLHRMAETAGLDIVATHALMTDDGQLEQVIAYNGAIGCARVVIPIAFFRNAEETQRFGDRLNRLGQRLSENGMKLYYHNHFHEFQLFQERSVLDILLAETDPELVGIELDTYWALRAGIDPAALLRRLGSRCELVHQKDLPATAAPVNLFDVIDGQAEISQDTLMRFGGAANFTEIGEGTMDIAGIVRAAAAYTDAQYFIVEQDATSRSELESIASSYRALSGILANIQM